MKRLNLTIKNPRGYVTAVSGIFISPKAPTGLTPKEMDVLAAIIVSMHEKGINVITKGIRQRIREQLGLSSRNLYNTVSELKGKGAISRDDMLHPVLRAPVSISVEIPEGWDKG